MCNGGNCSGVLGARPHPGPLSPCPTSYLLETVGLDQSLRTSMTTNQLSLVRTAIGRGTQFREPLTRRPVRANVMPCAFASLRLCVLTASVPTQRRRGAKTQRGPGQEVVDWIGRPRAIAENRSARLLTDEQSTASRWRNGRGSLRPVSMETLAATHPGRSVVIRTTMRRNLSFPTRFSGEPRMEHGWNTDSQKRPSRGSCESPTTMPWYLTSINLEGRPAALLRDPSFSKAVGVLSISVFNPCSIRGPGSPP